MDITSIVSSVSNGFIKDEFVKKGTFIKRRKNGREQLERYVGGFSVVFPFAVNNKKWAFRCWHVNVGNMQKHFDILSKELKKINLPYFCEFDYTEEGILVDGFLYPTTKMRWIDGDNLKNYICKNYHNKGKMKTLADSFLSMIKNLHQNNIAHGDLQHGNILIDNHDKIYLIDYDSVYLPALSGQIDSICGLPDYQHPKRCDNKYATEKIDYFSELIIYTSILGIVENPSLVEKYKLADSEFLLFSKEDFKDLRNSEIYKDLYPFGETCQLLLRILTEYLDSNDINNLEPFDKLLEKYSLPVSITEFKCNNGNVLLKGEKASFCWNIENASSIYFNGEKLPQGTQLKNIRVNRVGKEHFYLEATNGINKTKSAIELNIVNVPIIELTSNKFKLKKGKENKVKINWKIANAKSATLQFSNKEETIQLKDSLILHLEETSDITINVLALDNKTTISKNILIEILNESEIEFTSDKQYSYHKVPITLSWNIKHAKKAELNGKEVDFESSKIVTIDKDTTYTLKVQDEFGVKEKSITVRMLPLPVIKSILIPTPKIENTINIHQYIPRQNVDVRIEIPHIEIPEYEPLHVEFNKEDVELRNNTIEWNELMEMEKLNTKLHDSSFSHIFGNVYNKLNSKIKQLWKK